MDVHHWYIDRELRLQTGPRQGTPIQELFPEQSEQSPFWSSVYAALDGSPGCGSFERDGSPWRVTAVPESNGAHVVCARLYTAPVDPQELLKEYSLQGQALRPLAHNVNNQLGAICNYAALIEHQASNDLSFEAKHIQTLAFKASEQLNMMRTLSSPLEEPLRPTLLHRWLPALISSARLSHPQHHIQLGVVPEVRVAAVQNSLAVALHHVITNATEATLEGRPIRVAVSTGLLDASDLQGWDASPGSFAHIRIEDAGEGMDESTMESMLHVFESSRHPGRGLGLPLALSIIRQHKGRVRIESAPDVGTVVTLSLPVLAPSVRRSVPQVAVTKPTPAVTAKTLLVADDTSAVLRATTRLLQRAGYHVITASSGTEALAHFTAEPERFDAVLLDANMPGYGGVRLAEMINEQRPSLPVLLVTGQPPANCPWPVLEKPYRPSQLLALLQTLFL